MMHVCNIATTSLSTWQRITPMGYPPQAACKSDRLSLFLKCIPQLCPLVLPHLYDFLFLFSFVAVLRGALIKQLRIGLHEKLQYVEGQPMDGAIPMLLGVRV